MLFTPEPGSCVLDIGANNGAYAEAFAKAVGETGYVWAVEPHPTAVAIARSTLRPYPWAVVMQAAIGDKSGARPLYSGVDSRHSSFWDTNVVGEPNAMYTVHLTTVDALIGAMLREPDWIKVDAQGAEALILAGATQTLDAKQASWCVELWKGGLATAGASVCSTCTTAASPAPGACRGGSCGACCGWGSRPA